MKIVIDENNHARLERTILTQGQLVCVECGEEMFLCLDAISFTTGFHPKPFAMAHSTCTFLPEFFDTKAREADKKQSKKE